jgi:hypothetical protein
MKRTAQKKRQIASSIGIAAFIETGKPACSAILKRGHRFVDV